MYFLTSFSQVAFDPVPPPSPPKASIQASLPPSNQRNIAAAPLPQLPEPTDHHEEQVTDSNIWSKYRNPTSPTSPTSHTLFSLSFIFDDISNDESEGKYVKTIDEIANHLTRFQLGDPTDSAQKDAYAIEVYI